MSGLQETVTGLKLVAVAERLRSIESDRLTGVIKPVLAGSIRERVLCEGVMTLAKYLGVTLKPICAINSLGDLSLVSQGANPWDAAGVPFSKEFCDVLNMLGRPRCGMPGTVALMDPANDTWCNINHFYAEKMILAVADAMV
jgi:hypothetical protein